jgi:cell division protein FtsI/penicillin-binding protein 2
VTLSQILLITCGGVLLLILVQYGGMIESLRRVKSRGTGWLLAFLTLGLIGGIVHRSVRYMTPERERWIAVGPLPADSVAHGFNTKSRFRSLAQPLGRITDRNGTALAGYELRDRHLVRAYPAGEATAHIVGYWTGPIRDGAGVEKGLTLLNDSLRDDLPHDAHLSLDVKLQKEAQRALAGKAGAIVVMNASNGEVLAAANYPTYNPDEILSDDTWNRYARDVRLRPLTSRAIKDNFSPGSSIKTLIAAAAIHRRAALPESSGFVCTGEYIPIPRTKPITEHGSAHGRITIEQAMRYSCNIYFARLAYQYLGFDNTADYFSSLGFNERLHWNTGLFLNEYATLLPALSWVKGRDEIAKSRLGIGQASVKTNPIHFATVLAGIANGGRFIRPTMELGRRLDTLPWRMTPSVAARVGDLLRQPLMPGGTAAGAFPGGHVGGIEIYGKTGTADREPDGREPSWFISYGRRNGKTYVVVVAIQDRGDQFAGALNAPMARKMYEALERGGYYR